MSEIKYFEPKLIMIRDLPGLDERWVQDRLVDNPKLLGLGDLVVKDKERSQRGAGRRKAKSVAFTERGLIEARRLLQELFSIDGPPGSCATMSVYRG